MGYSIAEARRLLVLEEEVCRDVRGRRGSMRYEMFKKYYHK